jgi:hypothetical protein
MVGVIKKKIVGILSKGSKPKKSVSSEVQRAKTVMKMHRDRKRKYHNKIAIRVDN